METAVMNEAQCQKDHALWKEEIAAWKLEKEAEDIWAEAHELLKKGQRRPAEKLLRKLLRSKFAGTEVAQRVREKYPDL